MSSDAKITVGAAVDQIISALSTFAENDRRAILLAACTHLQINMDGTTKGDRSAPRVEEPHSAQPVIPQANDRRSQQGGLDIRSLKDTKNPNSARQMACLVAYYLQEDAPESERKDSISTADLEKYFKQANYKLPTKLEQLLIDCKSAGYFDSQKRGEYTLTRVGYNLVAHGMPSRPKA